MESFRREQELLLGVLAAVHDPNRGAELPASDPLLLAVARRHRLTPLLSAACGQTLPPALEKATRRDRVLTIARNTLLGHAAGTVVRSLQLAGVKTIVLKGLDYETRLYDEPGTRPTGDVDILVPDADRRRAFAVLDGLGFEPRAAAPGFDEPDYHEVAWTRDDIEVDLHMALAPLVRGEIDYRAVWDQAVSTRVGGTETLALARGHAAVFQALHMAIDHFDVPAIYLVDLARLVKNPAERTESLALASAWRCRRALDTALTLTSAILPGQSADGDAVPSWIARRIVAAYGALVPLSLPERLLRKSLHFDTLLHASRYLAVQSRRNLRERIERRVRRRSPRSRLGL